MSVVTEVLVALFGLCGAIGTAYFGYRSSHEKALRHQAEKEMEFQAAAMEFGEIIDEWSSIHEDLHKLLDESRIDRAIIFRAWNGALRPRWTTNILQYRKGSQEPISYQHYELDNDYVDRLLLITSGKPLRFKTDQIPDSGIKKIYEIEGVTESYWAHIGSKNLRTPGHTSRAITYMSFSTCHPDGFTKEDITKASMVLHRIKSTYRATTPTALPS